MEIFVLKLLLVDPVLTYSMPPSMTANTGIDALAQGIAGIIAKCSTPIGDAIGYEAVRLMTPALTAAYKDGNNKEARAAMAAGSMMAGLTMNISDCNCRAFTWPGNRRTKACATWINNWFGYLSKHLLAKHV